MAELLTSIQTGSGTPVFEPLSDTELELQIDNFTSNAVSITGSIDTTGFFRFSNDIMVVKEKNNLEFALDVFEQKASGPRAESESGSPTPDGPKRSKSSTITSYDYYQKGTYASVETVLRYNYNMTTASVETAFTNILGNIIQELKPPKTSTTFTYDFKFSQNRNRTLSGSSGGGY